MGGDRSSLQYCISKYGETPGRQKYQNKSIKLRLIRAKQAPSMKGKEHDLESKLKTSESVKNSVYHTNLRQNGRTQEEKERIKRSMQGVFTLGWFIKKYGKNGQHLYSERSKRISKASFFRKYNKTNKNNYSKKSQGLFWSIFHQLKLSKEEVYFAELNHEFGCSTNTNFDFVWKPKKKVIEFHGDFWHANPKYFEASEIVNPHTQDTASIIWKNNERKNAKAEKNGYKVLVIWEDDYKMNKVATEQKCIDFLIGE